ncbi:hypothetical protein M3J09_004404 [Ascochyta lentis]
MTWPCTTTTEARVPEDRDLSAPLPGTAERRRHGEGTPETRAALAHKTLLLRNVDLGCTDSYEQPKPRPHRHLLWPICVPRSTGLTVCTSSLLGRTAYPVPMTVLWPLPTHVVPCPTC